MKKNMLWCSILCCAISGFATTIPVQAATAHLVPEKILNSEIRPLKLTDPYEIQIQTPGQLFDVGNNATLVLLFSYNPPAGTKYEFLVTYPDTSTESFAATTRNLARFTITQAGTYQVIARIIDPDGYEEPWVVKEFTTP